MSQSYRDFLASKGLLGRGFSYGEIVKPNDRRHVEPPPRLYGNIVRTLEIAIELRQRCIEAGFGGLYINAAYRPTGGAVHSAHKMNRALDLDLLKADRSQENQIAYYLMCAAFWDELNTGGENVALGLYCGKGSFRGTRSHWDTPRRTPRVTWQMVRKASIKPPAAKMIVERLANDIA